MDRQNSKYSFAELCAPLGLSHPTTCVVADRGELLRKIEQEEPSLPAIVKPVGLSDGRGVLKLERRNAHPVARTVDYAPIVLRHYIEGVDACAFFRCRRGTVRAAVAYIKTSRSLEFFHNDAVFGHSRRIIELYAYDGVIGFDIRLHRNGTPYFIECNPRFWYNMDLVMLAGLNFVEVGLRDKSPALPDGESFRYSGIVRPRALVRMALAPWRIRRAELAPAGYYAADQVAHVMMSAQRAFASVPRPAAVAEAPERTSPSQRARKRRASCQRKGGFL